MKLISGDVPERFNGTDCKSDSPSGFAGSNPAIAANFATEAEASTSAPAFNHTAEAMQSATELYASAVSFPRMEKTQWTNNKNANKEDW